MLELSGAGLNGRTSAMMIPNRISPAAFNVKDAGSALHGLHFPARSQRKASRIRFASNGMETRRRIDGDQEEQQKIIRKEIPRKER